MTELKDVNCTTETNQYDTVGKCQRFTSILWPSFIMAVVACSLFWTIFDPDDLKMISGIDLSRIGFYTVSFFIAWSVTGISSFLSIVLCKPCTLVNK